LAGKRQGICPQFHDVAIAGEDIFSIPQKNLQGADMRRNNAQIRRSPAPVASTSGPDFQRSPCYDYKNLSRHEGRRLPSRAMRLASRPNPQALERPNGRLAL
jgi:hypothetical protein